MSEKKWRLNLHQYKGETAVSLAPLFDFFAKENTDELVPDLSKIKTLLAAKNFSEIRKQFPEVILSREVQKFYKEL